MAKNKRPPRRTWVQDTTLYIPPTTTVTEIHLKEEWRAVTSESLAKSLLRRERWSLRSIFSRKPRRD